VRALIEEIAGKHQGRRLGDAAAKALTALAHAGKPPAPAGLSGDLELFGLPNLLQTLGQSKLSGILARMDAGGRAQASLLFEDGRFRGGHVGSVTGTEAVYQLLERPFPGTFAFVSRADVASQPRVGPPADVVMLLMEGVRRYDELKRAAAAVPDGARLQATGKPHTTPDDEDPDFATLVWKHAISGKTAQECEAEIHVDSYRVRRLLASWLEQGALR
jgi:hypothetical protein